MLVCGLCNENNIVRFAQLDTAGTEASPGYDKVFQEPNLSSSGPDDPIGTVGRAETTYDLKCQVEVPQFSDRLRQTRTGKDRGAKYEITVDRRSLVAQSLIDSNGESMIRTGARVVQIMNRALEPQLVFAQPPGLFVEEIIYDSWMDEAFAIVVYVCTPRQRNV